MQIHCCFRACRIPAAGSVPARTLACHAQKVGAQTFKMRDVLPVPIRLVTVGKNNSKAAEAMSGMSSDLEMLVGTKAMSQAICLHETVVLCVLHLHANDKHAMMRAEIRSLSLCR